MEEERQLVEYCEKVHSQNFLTNLLRMKKEVAIQHLTIVLPLLKVKRVDDKLLILRILPVIFSYVTLYDTEVNKVFKICDTLRLHPAFSGDQQLFIQWFSVFERRMKNAERQFQYKDEYYFQDLPKLDTNTRSKLSKSIGYGDIALLRTVHRWLRVLRLHKYLYFFSNLTYLDIVSINIKNIGHFEKSVGVHNMTVGARNKILREVEELRTRRARLRLILNKRRFNAADLEEAAKQLKKIMRSPISLDSETVLIAFIVDTLKTVSYALYSLIGSSEKMIPLYGLIISILKEAYNYAYFSTAQKSMFNEWRAMVSIKINSTLNSGAIRQPILIPPRPREEYDYLDDDDDDTLSSDSTSPDEHCEMIAIQMANYVLL